MLQMMINDGGGGVDGDCEWGDGDGDGLDGRDGGGDGQDGREDGGDDQTAISTCLCFNATLTISRNAMVDPTENS